MAQSFRFRCCNHIVSLIMINKNVSLLALLFLSWPWFVLRISDILTAAANLICFWENVAKNTSIIISDKRDFRRLLIGNKKLLEIIHFDLLSIAQQPNLSDRGQVSQVEKKKDDEQNLQATRNYLRNCLKAFCLSKLPQCLKIDFKGNLLMLSTLSVQSTVKIGGIEGTVHCSQRYFMKCRPYFDTVFIWLC